MIIATPADLFTEHSAELFRLARHYSKSHEDAEDAMQEGFLRAVQFWDAGNPETRLAWAKMIVKNVCLDRFRKARARKAEAHVPVEEHDSITPGHEGPILARLAIVKLWGRLKPKEAQAIEQWMDGEEPRFPTTFRTRRHRGLAKLRLMLN